MLSLLAIGEEAIGAVGRKSPLRGESAKNPDGWSMTVDGSKLRSAND
jgi:hypothetical protein